MRNSIHSVTVTISSELAMEVARKKNSSIRRKLYE